MCDTPRARRFLWPQTLSFDGKIRRLSEHAVADLNLAAVVSSLAGTDAPTRLRQARERFTQRVLTEVVCQQGRCQVVRHHREWVWRTAQVRPDRRASPPRDGESDMLPSAVCLGADLSVGGGGQSVSTRAEVAGDSAKRD